MDNLPIVCSMILGMLIIVIAFRLEEKIDRLARLIFKDKITYSSQMPVSVNPAGKKHYKGKCPVCSSKVTSRRHAHSCPVCGQRLNWRAVKRKEKHK